MLCARGAPVWMQSHICRLSGAAAEAKLDAYLVKKYHPTQEATFSKAMALRRLHWKNSFMGEVLYYVNLIKVCSWQGSQHLPRRPSDVVHA
jgi:hypothetical protein